MEGPEGSRPAGGPEHAPRQGPIHIYIYMYRHPPHLSEVQGRGSAERADVRRRHRNTNI